MNMEYNNDPKAIMDEAFKQKASHGMIKRAEEVHNKAIELRDKINESPSTNAFNPLAQMYASLHVGSSLLAILTATQEYGRGEISDEEFIERMNHIEQFIEEKGSEL